MTVHRKVTVKANISRRAELLWATVRLQQRAERKTRLALIITDFLTLVYVRHSQWIMQTADLNLYVWFMVTDISYDLWRCKWGDGGGGVAQQEMKHNWKIDFVVWLLFSLLWWKGLFKRKQDDCEAVGEFTVNVHGISDSGWFHNKLPGQRRNMLLFIWCFYVFRHQK